ncbi:GtrA family protein [uncultured Sphingobacterium sp.]|uniref:GtrA family protein n=1 Tax=uncultured Sphingobacterium sp. TaxID=182688 RepID=UPI00345C15ED
MNIRKFNSALRFCTVGSIGFIIDFSTTLILKEYLGAPPFLANTIGFCLAVSNGYFMNKYWTYQQTGKANIHQFNKFVISNIIGLILNTLIIKILIETGSYSFFTAKIIATIIVVAWNFSAATFFIFKPAKS